MAKRHTRRANRRPPIQDPDAARRRRVGRTRLRLLVVIAAIALLALVLAGPGLAIVQGVPVAS